MEIYDPLSDILEVAAECCDESGKRTKAAALRRLEAVLREEPELSKQLQRKIAFRLESEFSSSVN